jgi:hypothetical protein
VSLDRTERTGLPEHDSDIKSAVDNSVWAEQLEQAAGTGKLGQDSQDGTAGTEQPGRTAGIGQLGQDSWDKTAGTGQPGQETWDRKVIKTDGIVHQERKPRQNGQNMSARTGQLMFAAAPTSRINA